jgi:UDP-N-acetylglucosamine--N-acetylmuramyl-(pentapeptide) pyrophosphoryl-undecaprenol N-acetylglucosamine transferase
MKYSLEMAYFGIDQLGAILKSLKLISLKRPSVVVVFGGYSAIAPALVGVSMRIPLVVVNVDAIAGGSNRILSRFARAVAVAWPGTGLAREQVTGIPVSSGIVETGCARRMILGSPSGNGGMPSGQDGQRWLPERWSGEGGQEMAKGLREAEELRRSAREALGLPEDRVVILAAGGSLGARRLNELVMDLSSIWAERSDLAVYHIAGERFLQESSEYARRLGLQSSDNTQHDGHNEQGGGIYYRQVGYESRMDKAYLAADFAICRAGAVTVGELAVAALPALLIPLPGAPSRHQEANAAVLTSIGAAVMVEEKDTTAAKLAETLERIVGDRERLEKMSAAYPDLDNGYGTSRLADLVERYVKRSDD